MILLSNIVKMSKEIEKELESIINSSDSNISDSGDDVFEEGIDFTGSILQDNYIIIKKIGCGSFATVWLAYNLNYKIFNAIKIQHPEDFDAGDEEVDIFKRVKKTGCKYLNVMDEYFIETTEEGEHICMVFELMAGSLYDVIDKGKYSNGLDFKLVKNIMYQLLEAMNVLNNKLQLLHTDIKPENILVHGVGNKTKNIIDEFNKLNFNKFYNKKKTAFKKKKKGKNVNFNDYKETVIKEFLGKMETIQTEVSSESLNENDCLIDEQYLDNNNIIVKLSDFGSCCPIEDHMSFEIQTRYYRSPEIMLYHKFNTTCDVWSVGCVFYELLTGKVLFNPEKRKGFNRDRSHIYEIQKKLGKLPDRFIEKSQKRKLFFKNNGLIKGRNSFEFKPLYDLLVNKLNDRKDINNEDLDNIIDFLYYVLRYNPKKRPTPNQCLKHKLFDDFQKPLNKNKKKSH